MQPSYAKGRGFSFSRRYDAPPEMVWEAWTDPAQLDWFYNPGEAVSVPIEVDLRVGGTWRQQMVIDADTQYMTGGVYAEIVPHRRLAFYWGAAGGWPSLDPERPWDSPVCTVELEPVAGGTKMTFKVALPDHLGAEKVEELAGPACQAGWPMTIDRMLPARRLAA